MHFFIRLDYYKPLVPEGHPSCFPGTIHFASPALSHEGLQGNVGFIFLLGFFFITFVLFPGSDC